MLPTLPSPGRAWHCGSGQPEARTQWSHGGAQGVRGRHRGRGCGGQGPWRGLGQRKAGGSSSFPALQTPASPCTHTHTCARTHTHTRARTHTTHMHTTPPGQSQPGGTGYIQHSPPVGTSRSGQDQRHSNPEPEQPHLSREAGADRGRRGRDWGQAGERQGGHRLRLQGPSSGLYWELEGVMLME